MISSDCLKNIPIAISYRPKRDDYLPVVVAAIRRHMGDWPIVILCEAGHLPPNKWLQRHAIQAITDWEHSPGANKVLRLWEHQEVYSRHLESWIWWHDDMLLLRQLQDPHAEFQRPLVRHAPRARPNRKLSNWHGWLWDTLGFFACQGIPAPNPVLHIPRLINRTVLQSIPKEWDRSRLLFEPTYLLWHWHQAGLAFETDEDYRIAVFDGLLPPIAELERSSHTFMTWGRSIDQDSARAELARCYPVDFLV